jgi:hypothetical protein
MMIFVSVIVSFSEDIRRVFFFFDYLNECTQSLKHFASYCEHLHLPQLPTFLQSHIVLTAQFIYIYIYIYIRTVCLSVLTAITLYKVILINQRVSSALPSTVYCSINFASGGLILRYGYSYCKGILRQPAAKGKA